MANIRWGSVLNGFVRKKQDFVSKYTGKWVTGALTRVEGYMKSFRETAYNSTRSVLHMLGLFQFVGCQTMQKRITITCS